MKKKISEMVSHKRQDTTATVIPCLYLLLFTVLRTLAVGLPVNKKRTESFLIENRVQVRTVWWRIRDSNPRPPACDAGALTS